MRFLPLSARRSLAQSLNLYVARSALGQDALDDLCAGAAAALPEIARLLTAASAGDAEAARGLESIFTAPLLARYINDLDRLRDDNVHLDLQVRRINSAQIRQLRTETGPAEAYTAADAYRYHRQQDPVLGTAAAAAAAKPMSMLRAGLARQRYEYTNVFGASYAGAQQSQQRQSRQQQSQQPYQRRSVAGANDSDSDEDIFGSPYRPINRNNANNNNNNPGAGGAGGAHGASGNGNGGGNGGTAAAAGATAAVAGAIIASDM
ncbi:hypothetical protein GGH99_008895 [Coemansia sp. RSA 1285]|nr:hypothetical protein GGH99_008895 [Coemansia sp. RSA 1285]